MFAMFAASAEAKGKRDSLDHKDKVTGAGQLLAYMATEQDVDLVGFSSYMRNVDGRSNLGRGKHAIAEYFMNTWIPEEYLLKEAWSVAGTNSESQSLGDVVLGALSDSPGLLIIQLGNLTLSEMKQWVIGHLVKKIYVEYSKTRATIHAETGDPEARLAICYEEMHEIVPQKGQYNPSAGLYDNSADDFCRHQVRNLALRGRKYGIGQILQRLWIRAFCRRPVPYSRSRLSPRETERYFRTSWQKRRSITFANCRLPRNATTRWSSGKGPLFPNR